MKFVSKHTFGLTLAAVVCAVSYVLIPVSIVILFLLYKDLKNKKNEELLHEAFDKANDEHKAKLLLLDEIYEKAKADNQQKIDAIRTEISEPELLLNKLKEQAIESAKKEMIEIEEALSGSYAELKDVTEELDKSNKTVSSNAAKLLQLQIQTKALKAMLKRIGDDPAPSVVIDEALLSQTDEILSATIELRLHYMDVRQLKSLFNQNKKVINDTLKKYQSRYTTKALSTLYKLMVLALEAELQNVLFNLRFGKLENAERDIRSITIKYQQIASDGNQLIAPTIAKFIAEIEYLYIEAVKIEYEYYTKREAIKEEQRALREQMRQEAEERKRMEQELKRIENEEVKFKNEMDTLANQLSSVQDESVAKALQERIDELQQQLNAVADKKEDIARLQHGKAGYVYIISNLGSFGDNVFKVGMTRRLEPMDRVVELGDASVPFPFDVHSLIFSDDAVGLENELHKKLHANRLNRVNLRKEFFHTTLDELEEMVYSYQPTAEFTRTMLAEQYNQSLSMAGDDIPDTINISTDDGLDDDLLDEAI